MIAGRFAVLCALMLIGLSARPASAQDGPIPMGIIASPPFTPPSVDLDDAEEGAGDESRRPRRGSPPVASGVALRFTPSSARRQANYASFVAKSRRIDPAGADGLASVLDSDPIDKMAPELAKYGLRTDDVADAYAAWWMEAWDAVHGVSSQTSRAMAAAVKRQAAGTLLATAELATASDSVKQEVAESLLIQALLIAAARNQAGDDRARLDQVAAAVDQGARASGLNLRAMTLSDAGFADAEGAAPAPVERRR